MTDLAQLTTSTMSHEPVGALFAGANIASLDEYSTAPHEGASFQRTAFQLPGLSAVKGEFEKSFVAQVRNRST